MKLRQLKRREVTLLVITISVLLAFLIKFYVLKPLKDWDHLLSKQIKKELIVESKNEYILQSRMKIQDNFKWILSKYGKERNSAKELGVMVNDIETLAKNIGIFIVQMQPRKPVQNENFYNYYVDLNFNANWNELIEFLSKVESEPFFYKIDSIKIERAVNKTRRLKGTMVIFSERFELSG